MGKITGQNLSMKYIAECDCGGRHEVEDIRSYHPKQIVKAVCDFCKEEFCDDCKGQVSECETEDCDKKFCEACAPYLIESFCSDCVEK